MARARHTSGGWLTVALGIAAASCTGEQPPPRPPEVPVHVAATTRIAAPVEVSANGVVEPMQTVAVEAQVGGTLTDVTFHEGDDVQAGQVLFRIDARPYEAALRQAEATLARDAAQAANARRDAARYRALVAKDYVTRSQADQAEATAVAQEATVQADQAAAENARLNVGYTTLRAPIAGRTGSLLVRRGNLIKPNSGTPLVVINQIHPILVRFPVLQRDFTATQRRMAQAPPVSVRVTTADSVPVAERGALSFLDNAVDSLTGTVTAKARFANVSGALWPGEYVRVAVELEVQPNVLAVPSSAVLSGQEGSYVFVVDTARTARMRPVTAGRAVGQLTVIERGLAEGERVVTDGQSRLTPGARVSITAQPPATASRSSP